MFDVCGVAAGEAVEFALAELGRIALDAALGAAERKVQQGVFPRHQGGEGADFVEIGKGVVADATLVGASGSVMLDPVAVENLDGAVVHADGHLDSKFAPGAAEHLPQPVGQVEAISGAVNEVIDLFKWAKGSAGYGGHGCILLYPNK